MESTRTLTVSVIKRSRRIIVQVRVVVSEHPEVSVEMRIGTPKPDSNRTIYHHDARYPNPEFANRNLVDIWPNITHLASLVHTIAAIVFSDSVIEQSVTLTRKPNHRHYIAHITMVSERLRDSWQTRIYA